MVNITIKKIKIDENIENENVLEIKIVSANILILGGAPKFLAFNINHQIVNAGNKFISPLIKFKLRVNEVS